MDEIIKECIDMDEWKHSHHNKLISLDNLIDAEKVIAEKIMDRKDELSKLASGLACVKLRINDFS